MNNLIVRTRKRIATVTAGGIAERANGTRNFRTFTIKQTKTVYNS